jgi:hypothetical protein
MEEEGKKRKVGLTRSLRQPRVPPPTILAAETLVLGGRPAVALATWSGGGDAGAKLALHPEQGQRKRPAATGGKASRR